MKLHDLFALTLLATGAVRPALADSDVPADSTARLALPEIVVTATRTPEKLLRVPASVTLINRGRFSEGRGISLKDALLEAPGVFAQSRSGGQDTRLTIRGFGARGAGERSNAGVSRGIRVLTDGIPISEPDGRTSLDLADLGGVDQVEVTRSNASALYGNASGGVVNLRTNLDFEEPFRQVRVKGGSYGYHREQAFVGARFGDSRATVSLGNSTFDGWREHSATSTSLLQARVKAVLDPRTKLGILLDATSNLNRYPGPLTAAQLDSAPEMANRNFLARNERRINRIARLGTSIEHRFSADRELSGALWTEAKKLQRSERNRFRDFNRGHVGATAQLLQRLTLSDRARATLSLGGDEAWQDGSVLFYNLGPGGTRGTTQIADSREAANSAGGYVQAEVTLNDTWSARVAARYDDVYYLSEDHTDPSLNAKHTFSRWTPKASLAWLRDRHTVFVTLGGGVEAPAFNEIDPPAPFDTLTSINPFLRTTHSSTLEAGARGVLADGSLKYDAALYWITVNDDFIPYDGGVYYFTAGKTRRQGAELGLDWSPVERLALRGAFTLSRNRYVDYKNNTGDFKDNRVAGLPENVSHVTARYALRQGFFGELKGTWVGSYFANDANSARVPAYALLGIRVGYTGIFETRAIHAYVGVENLTDQKYVESVFINGLNGQFFEPGLPRNFIAGLTIGL